MKSVLSAPSTFTIAMPIEELALFWRFAEGTPMSAGRVDGHMEISVDMSIAGGDWFVSEIWIDVENHRMGAENKWHRAHLSADEDQSFYWLILDAIDHQYSTRIETVVQDQLSVARYERAA